MKFTLTRESQTKVRADLLVLGRFANQALPYEGVEALLKKRQFKSGLGQMEEVPAPRGFAASRVAVIGLGEPFKKGSDAFRQAAAVAARFARATGEESLALAFPKEDSGAGATARWTQAIVEGCELGLFRFVKYLSDKRMFDQSLKNVHILFEGDPSSLRDAVARGQIYAKWTIFARELVCEPAGVINPKTMAEIARAQARKAGLRIRIVDAAQAKKLGMGCLTGVGQGSVTPPCLIHLSYRAKNSKAPRMGILGKGITFDSGGLSLKPAKSMETMKDDMAGSAAVLGTMLAVAELKPDVHVDGVMCMAENMPSGSAIRPGDVLKSYSGKTVEVLNTDAEGRLVLADGLTYLQKQKVDGLVDLATLTGACLVALGDRCAGVMSFHDDLSDLILKAGKGSGEMFATLPMIEEYRDAIKSDVADVKNIGDGNAGTIAGALFLAEFVERKLKWAHLDIAGPAYTPKDWTVSYAGGTGFGVRMLLNLLFDPELPGVLRNSR